ncbi:MAG TPA: PAS domain S-box protein [Chitinophagaceae bacterium]|nr:PAS domain S-box protein [Chitinophagaceae bacterium]
MSDNSNIQPPRHLLPGDDSEYLYAGDIFSILVENVKDYAIFIVDVDGNINTWNKGAENIKGYSADEIKGKNIAIFYTQKDVESGVPQHNLQQAALHGRYENEGWRVRKDGSQFWANVVFTSLYDAGGLLKGYAKITRDITDKKLAQDAYKHQASLLEISADAIFSFNAANRLQSWNKAAENIYGYTAAEVIHRDVVETIKPVMDDDTRMQLRQQVNDKGFWSGEVIHTARYGVQVPVYISVAVQRNSNGEIEEYVCICRDISAKKAEEEKLRKMQEELEKLTQSKLTASLKDLADYKYALDKSSIVAITNQKGIIQYVNENFCHISGYSRQELIGKDHRIVNSGYHSKEFIRNLWVTIAGGNVWKGELKNKAKSGNYYWVDTTIVPFLNDEGKPYQYIAIRADITSRKAAEEELQLLNDQLEQRIIQRTQQLEQSNKELEAFSYSVSHDLRSPLRSVSGFAKILEEDYGHLLDDEGHRLLRKIVSNALNMGRLIDDLLTFTRLGRLEAVQGEIDMNALVNTCIKELAQTDDFKHYTINIDPLPACHGDVNMFKQVWLNLIGNAIKYSSKQAAPVIAIKAAETADAVVYSVQDNGVGFDMEYYGKLFGVFQRLHSADEFAGTGVGLALVKLIITRHGGSVWAQSQPGAGATFYFSILKTNRYEKSRT